MLLEDGMKDGDEEQDWKYMTDGHECGLSAVVLGLQEVRPFDL